MSADVYQCYECGGLIFFAHDAGYPVRVDLVATGPMGRDSASGQFTVDFDDDPPKVQAARDSDLERGKVRFRSHVCPPARTQGVSSI